VLGILQAASKVLRKEPNVVEVQAPVTVCGDIHGQFLDLVELFHVAGGLLHKTTADTPKLIRSLSKNSDDVHQFLFLGDYVDRGCFSCECVIYLLALKSVCPDQIHLLRGNHECRCMTSRCYAEGTNFKQECEAKYGSMVYDQFMECFDALPLCAVVKNKQGQWLCVHGGIGPKVQTLNDIMEIDRFREPPLTGPVCDLLWSDPINEDLAENLTDKDYEEFLGLDYIPNPPRGCSYFYCYDSVNKFVEENQLKGIVRGHECKEDGVSFHFVGNRTETFPHPLVTTVFSAPNYCGTYGNRGAILRFTESEMKVRHFNSSLQKAQPVTVDEDQEVFQLNQPSASIEENMESVKITMYSEDELEEDEELPPIARPRFLSTPVHPRGSDPGFLLVRGDTLKRRRASIHFQKAMERDAASEVHPGWQSLRRLHKVIGRISLLCKHSPSSKLKRSSDGRSRFKSEATNEQQPLPENSCSVEIDHGRQEEQRRCSSLSPPPEDLSSSQLGEQRLSPPPSPLDDMMAAMRRAKDSRKSMSLRRTLSGVLKPDDMLQVRYAFQAIDRNNDGYLTTEELVAFAQDIGEYCNTNDQVARMLEAMGTDQDGRVGFKEFTEYIARVASESAPSDDRQKRLSFFYEGASST
jgi:diadenosine tetraphosphatase ApaH/serine/threonine PP2A family protein phosphatase